MLYPLPEIHAYFDSKLCAFIECQSVICNSQFPILNQLDFSITVYRGRCATVHAWGRSGSSSQAKDPGLFCVKFLLAASMHVSRVSFPMVSGCTGIWGHAFPAYPYHELPVCCPETCKCYRYWNKSWYCWAQAKCFSPVSWGAAYPSFVNECTLEEVHMQDDTLNNFYILIIHVRKLSVFSYRAFGKLWMLKIFNMYNKKF